MTSRVAFGVVYVTAILIAAWGIGVAIGEYLMGDPEPLVETFLVVWLAGWLIVGFHLSDKGR